MKRKAKENRTGTLFLFDWLSDGIQTYQESRIVITNKVGVTTIETNLDNKTVLIERHYAAPNKPPFVEEHKWAHITECKNDARDWAAIAKLLDW